LISIKTNRGETARPHRQGERKVLLDQESVAERQQMAGDARSDLGQQERWVVAL